MTNWNMFWAGTTAGYLLNTVGALRSGKPNCARCTRLKVKLVFCAIYWLIPALILKSQARMTKAVTMSTDALLSELWPSLWTVFRKNQKVTSKNKEKTKWQVKTK